MTQWPTVEDATRRMRVLIEDQAGTDTAARDLIVLMRELERLQEALKARDELIARMWLGSDAALKGP